MADVFSYPDLFDNSSLFPARRTPAAYPPLSDLDTDTAVKQLTRGTLSGLGYVGSTLDKLTGGRAVRGLLAGKPRELLSLLPGSDVAGITNEADTVRGEDLYRSVTGRDANQGNWLERNLVGPAVEIGLDPATYLGGVGALTRAGKALAKTGQVTPGFLASVRAGQRSVHPLVALAAKAAPGAPGMASPVQLAAANAVEGAGKLGKALNVGVRRTVPGVALAEDVLTPVAKKAELIRRSLFRQSAGNIPEEEAQGAFETMFPRRRSEFQAIGEREVDLRHGLQQVMKETGLTEPEAQRYMRQMGENVPTSLPEGRTAPSLLPEHEANLGLLRKAVRAESPEGFVGPSFQPELLTRLGEAVHPELYQHGPSRAPALSGLVQELRDLGVTGSKRREDVAGVKSFALDDPRVEYMMRQGSLSKGGSVGGGVKSQGTKQFGTTHPSFLRRKEALRDWLGGTVGIEDVMTPNLAGAQRSWGRKKINEYLVADQLARLKAQGTTQILPAELARIQKNAVAMQRMLGAVPRENVLGGPTGGLLSRLGFLPRAAQPAAVVQAGVLPERVPFYDPDVIRANVLRAQRAAKSGTSADAIVDMMRRTTPLARGLPTDVPLPEVLRRTRMDTDQGVLRALSAAGVGPEQRAAWLAAKEAALGEGGQFDVQRALRDMLAQYAMPAEHARSASRMINGWQMPEALQPVIRGLDRYLGLFKTGTYSIWPGSLVRNIASGRSENLLEGGMSPVSPFYGRARRILSGTPEDTGIPSFAHLSPEDQVHALYREAYPRGIIGGVQGEIAERVGAQGTGKFGLVGSQNPLAPRQGYAALIGQLGKSLGTKGSKGLLDLGEIGRAAGQTAEDRLRLAEYMHLRASGHPADVAQEIVDRTHFDYARKTDFQRNVINRLAPFPTYTTRNIPKQLGRAITRPTTISAPIRFSGMLQEDEGQGDYVPEYLRSGLALPLTQPIAGVQRYLSQLGLPLEEAFGRLKIGQDVPGTLAQTGEGMLGMLRPEARGLLEALAGRQFFTGRNLQDLHVGKIENFLSGGDERTGQIISQVLSMTPASRAVSSGNRLLDERKYSGGLPGVAVSQLLPFLSGARVTDVDTEKWRAIDARNQLEREMQAAQHIKESRDYYADRKARLAGEVTPEEAQMLRAYAALKARSRAVADQKRLGIQIGGG